jgi:SagB-type dehydrogenase family enzyme
VRSGEADLYELFWENSKLSGATLPAFASRMAAYGVRAPTLRALRYPAAEVPLKSPADGLARLMRRRRSGRAFSSDPVSLRELGRLLGAFASTGPAARTFPSAGATYAVEVFCLLNNVEGDLSGHAVYYNHDRHTLSVVGEIPSWEEYAGLVNLETTGVPQLVFVFVVLAERTTKKYGERGGRFALFEVGHAAQNLALRAAQEGLTGCAAGGLWDDRIKALLRLEDTEAHIALGYVCGRPPRVAAAHALRSRLRRAA